MLWGLIRPTFNYKKLLSSHYFGNMSFNINYPDMRPLWDAGVRGVTTAFYGAAKGASQQMSQAAFDVGHDLGTGAIKYASAKVQNFVKRKAQRLSNTVNGKEVTAVGTSEGCAVPAMFIPGKGKELAVSNKVLNHPIYFRTGDSSGPPGPHDPFKSMLQLYKGVKLDMTFAWKNPLVAPVTSLSYVVTRTYSHQVFRHYNYKAIQHAAPGVYAANTANWNLTLGPDSSRTRLDVASGGSATAADAAACLAAGFNSSILSPYRTVPAGTVQYARITQQFCENMGWNCHPDKVINFTNDGQLGTLRAVSKTVYANSATTSQDTFPKSLPAQQPNTAGATQSPYYYKSQMGKGKLAYAFSNDGSAPAVVDIVIHKIKKGQNWDSVNNPTLLDDVYKNGFSRMVSNNTGFVDLGGQQPVSTDVLNNAKVQFLPAACLRYAQNQASGSPLDQDATMPFKQLARDQFIISAGATRAWSIVLPSLDYDPRRYGISDIASNAPFVCTDHTYIVSIAYSTVPMPLVETSAASANQTVIDRRSSDVNVSATGSYTEYCYPVYLADDVLTHSNINGQLDAPYFTSAGTSTIQSSILATIDQSIRTSGESSAVINVGALSTVGGA